MTYLLIAAAFSVGAIVGFFLRHILVEDAPRIERRIKHNNQERDTDPWQH